jgi:hypothetical protein
MEQHAPPTLELPTATSFYLRNAVMNVREPLTLQ